MYLDMFLSASVSIPQVTGDITIFLFLRAFASGCTALTGIEAVSNGIPSFKDPAQKNAKIVLQLLAFVVLLIFGGLSYLATLYHAVPSLDSNSNSSNSYSSFWYRLYVLCNSR